MPLIAAASFPRGGDHGEAVTAQTLHASLGVGLAGGPLYAALGGAAFWAMAELCAVAVPVAWRLRVVLATGQAGQTPIA